MGVRKPKILLFDIEASNLNADFGYVLSFGYKWLGEPKNSTVVFGVDDFKDSFNKRPTDDRMVVEKARGVLDSADAVVSWYGKKFDIPYLNSRLIFHKLPVIAPLVHVDAWAIARYQMKLHSNRLASVSAFLDIEEKTPLSGPIWIAASAGDKKNLAYVKEHNAQDVIVLEQAFLRIRPLIVSHPNLGLVSGTSYNGHLVCPICNTVDQLQSRGWSVASTSKRKRYWCKECGAWSKGKPEGSKGVEAR